MPNASPTSTQPAPFHLTPVNTQANPTGAGVLYGEQTFVAAAPGEPGVNLFARQWRPASGPVRAQVVVVHGYMEHGGRYRELAHALAHAQIATLSVDLRGHGHSAGPRGYVRRFADYLGDVAGTLKAFAEPPTFLLGHSLGGLISLDFVSQHAPDIAGLIVTNAYLDNGRPPPAYKLLIGRGAGKLFPRLNLPSGMPLDGLSHDTALLQGHSRDPLIFTHANAAWFRESRQAQARVRALTSVGCPLLYVYSDADPIALPAANAELSAKLQDADKTVVLRTGEYHEVLNEVRRADLFTQIVAWILARSPGLKG
jgi:alpha-beta hydrolase superfamily lysophospholipase